MSLTDDEIDARLFQRSKGGIWYVRDQRAGQDIRRSLRSRSKKEARKRARHILEHREAAIAGLERVTVEQASLVWAEEALPEAVKPRTAARYLTSAKVLLEFFQKEAATQGRPDLYVDELRLRHINKFVRQRLKLVSKRTIRNDLTTLGEVLSFSVSQEWREDNPMLAFDRKLIRTRRTRRPIPSDEQLADFLDYCPPMVARALRVLSSTGMREEEGISLTWAQVDWTRREIDLGKTKNGRPRIIPLRDKICRDAAGTLEGTPRHIKTPYVFWHGEGSRYHNFSSRFCDIRRRANKKRKKAGLPPLTFTVHDLRHKFAVDHLRANLDLYRLQGIMGHSSIKQTEEYLDHLDPTNQQQAKGTNMKQQRS